MTTRRADAGDEQADVDPRAGDRAAAASSNGIALVCGTFDAGSWNGPLIRMLARSMPMKDIISVVMISFVP